VQVSVTCNRVLGGEQLGTFRSMANLLDLLEGRTVAGGGGQASVRRRARRYLTSRAYVFFSSQWFAGGRS